MKRILRTKLDIYVFFNCKSTSIIYTYMYIYFRKQKTILMVHPENYYLIRCFLQDSMHLFHFKQMIKDTFPPINPCKEDV